MNIKEIKLPVTPEERFDAKINSLRHWVNHYIEKRKSKGDFDRYVYKLFREAAEGVTVEGLDSNEANQRAWQQINQVISDLDKLDDGA